MKITLGSLFDGIGGFPLAASRYGIKALWASEIEPFPIKVTKIRLPDMKHLSDITKINGAEIEPVDIITFGSPCQDLSVAGKRAGLAGERSGLFMEAVRIIKEMRNTYAEPNKPIQPRFAVWENVPGAFSSNKGEDFRAVLEEICRVKDETVTITKPPKGKWSTVGAIMGNGYSIAWRVLDAQFWGVPQRRRRIFLVADFGGQSAPEILFKRKGLSRYIKESREARERVTTDAQRSTPKTMLIRCGKEGGGKGALIQDDKSATLSTLNIQTLFQPTIAMNERQYALTTTEETANTLTGTDYKGTQLIFSIENHAADSRVKLDESGTCQTLTSRMGTGGGKVPMLAVPTIFNEETITSKTNASNPQPGDPCHTLGATGAGRAICIQGSMIGRKDKNGPQGDGINEDVSFTLNTTDRHAVATKIYGICSYASNSMKSSNPHSGIYEAETSRTIDLNGGSPACNQGGMAIVQCIEPGALSRGQGERVWDKCPTLRANMGDNQPCVVLNDQGGSQMDVSENVVGTLRAEMHGNIPAVTTYSFQRSDEFKETDKASTQSWRQYKDATDLVVGVDAYNHKTTGDKACSLTASSGSSATHSGPMVSQRYSVRRLTPLECERLQGFPDDWTDIPGTTEVTKEELEFWRDVWFTWDRTQAKELEKVKPRTDKAILKWLKNPVSDSAQYKALGNSVAVPCPEYVMEGISEVFSTER